MAAVIAAMTKAVASLSGTILLFVVISQFVDYFNYSNIPALMALTMADALKSANIGALWLLVGFIIVVLIIDFVFTPAIAKWAIFAPVFVPVFVQLSVDRRVDVALHALDGRHLDTAFRRVVSVGPSLGTMRSNARNRRHERRGGGVKDFEHYELGHAAC